MLRQAFKSEEIDVYTRIRMVSCTISTVLLHSKHGTHMDKRACAACKIPLKRTNDDLLMRDLCLKVRELI